MHFSTCEHTLGIGRVPTRGLFSKPDPNRTILRTRVTRGIILSNPRDQNLTTWWFAMHCSALLQHFCMHYSTIHESPTPCNFFVKFGQNWLTNVKKTWPELDPNQILLTRAQKSLTQDPTWARSQKQKPDLRTKKKDPTHP